MTVQRPIGMVVAAAVPLTLATIITMGRSLGIELVAEGVETADQVRALDAMGCHHLQGYHISRPVDPAALLLFAAGRAAPPA